ncbi:MAG TPA: DUF2442 domain-containing protein [Tepidisphaeraceae bacterium]|nr:DUF2442 domain-containing protein [Tepidisphaeraceae bacterium]
MPDEIDFSSAVNVVGGGVGPDDQHGDLRVEDVAVDSKSVTLFLTDGRVCSAPLEWYPELLDATPKQRRERQIRAMGRFVFWPSLKFALASSAIIKGTRSRSKTKRRKSA